MMKFYCQFGFKYKNRYYISKAEKKFVKNSSNSTTTLASPVSLAWLRDNNNTLFSLAYMASYEQQKDQTYVI